MAQMPTRTRAHARTHARTRTGTRMLARAHARTSICTHEHALEHAHAHAHAHARTLTMTHTQTHAPTPTHTHACAPTPARTGRDWNTRARAPTRTPFIRAAVSGGSRRGPPPGVLLEVHRAGPIQAGPGLESGQRRRTGAGRA